MKAVLLQRGFNFRYVHDIDELLVDLEKSGVCVPESLCDAVELTVYACQARYPGVGEPVTFEEYGHALASAERIVNWAAAQVADRKEPATRQEDNLNSTTI